MEAAVVTATGATQGAAIGALMGTLSHDISSSILTPPPGALNLNPQTMASLKQAQGLLIGFSGGPLIQARRSSIDTGPHFAVMAGVNAGIACVMKRLRGKEDVESTMVVAFECGLMFSLASGMGGANQASNALTSGLIFALIQGGLVKIGQKFSAPPAEDVCQVKTRSMLSNLDFQNFEKNFKAGLLTDSICHCLQIVLLEMVKFRLDQGF